MKHSEEIRRMLDELGIEHRDTDKMIDDGDGTDAYGKKHSTSWFHNGIECTFVHLTYDSGWEETVFNGGFATGVTPAEAIAATVGNRTDLSKRLREVNGLHAFAELFGFDWTDDSDWTWHDVACAMADAVDAATVGAGTCKVKKQSDGYGWSCECGNFFPPSVPPRRYCPHCGRRIEVSE